MKILFGENDSEDYGMVISNMFNPGLDRDIIVATEPKHVIKRLRNNKLASGE